MNTTTPPVTDLRLVVGSDGSPPASRALDAAVNLLRGRADRIEVVYVAHMPSMAALSPGAVTELETNLERLACQASHPSGGEQASLSVCLAAQFSRAGDLVVGWHLDDQAVTAIGACA